MNFAYTRGGAPLVRWNTRHAPYQSRAADTVSLGSLSGSTLAGSTLPAPGAPEPILGGLGGCSCSGSCGCGSASPAASLSGIADSVPGGYITLGVAAFFAWRYLSKRKRR